MDYFRYGNWEVRFGFDKGYVFICCPIMNGDVDFKVKRQIYKELKMMEEELSRDFKCWVAYTGEKNWHIMKMFEKFGAKPFHKSIKNKIVWFRKEI